MRKKIFNIIEAADDDDILSKIYDLFMIIVILASIFPLAFKSQTPLFMIIDNISVIIFIFDYLLRWWTSDIKLKKGKLSFVIYPFTTLALIDLISILPSITIIHNGFRLLKIVRLIRAFKVFRILKAFRYSKNIAVIIKVFKKEKDALIVVLWLATGYVLISALIVFNVEPDAFQNFFEAVYWSVVSLTTMGYGDIYPISTAGRVITILSAIFGIAIIALPASIITAGYMNELKQQKDL